ncbi:MAG: prenyltransferase [Cellvibrionaceae bacterium]
MTSSLKTAFLTTRPNFLVLTPIAVMLGVSCASPSAGSALAIVLALMAALLAHICVNSLNEHQDYQSGLDLHTERTPFSGGSGALPSNPRALPQVKAIAVTSFLGTLAIGGYFVWLRGSEIIPLGLLGLFLIASYTQWINKHPLICLIAPGLGFGGLMVAGTAFVLEGFFTSKTILASGIVFCLVNNLLLLNQYPDIQADKTAGRYHFPIAFGIRASNFAYGFFVITALGCLIAGVSLGDFPLLSLLAGLPISLSVFSLGGAIKLGDNIGQAPKYLAANVGAALITPLVLAITL